jgi:hypothetical protein
MTSTTNMPRSAATPAVGKTVAATVSTLMAAVFVVLLLALHAVRADLAPSWHMVSEYGIGRFGWLMDAAFFALAGALFALMFALVPVARGWLGALGLVFLSLASVGLTMGGMFTTDPAGTLPEQATRAGMLHGISFMLGVPSILLAVTLINIRLWRDAGWQPARLLLVATGGLVWLTMIVFAVAMVTCVRRGAVGPEFVVGWQNRAVVLAWAVWAIALSWRLRSQAAAIPDQPAPSGK